MTRLAPALLLAAGGLAACSQQYEPFTGQNAFCRAIATPGSTVTTTTSAPTTFSEPPRLFDGNLETSGALLDGNNSKASQVRGTLPAGQSVTALGAGFLFDGPNISNANIDVTTYLSGVPQESGPAIFTYWRKDASGNPLPGLQWYGIHTTLPFDAIEVSFALQSGDPPSLTILELCVR